VAAGFNPPAVWFRTGREPGHPRPPQTIKIKGDGFAPPSNLIDRKIFSGRRVGSLCRKPFVSSGLSFLRADGTSVAFQKGDRVSGFDDGERQG
jgi:hypothetical protein